MTAWVASGQRILVVDDDPTVSDVVRRYLGGDELPLTVRESVAPPRSPCMCDGCGKRSRMTRRRRAGS